MDNVDKFIECGKIRDDSIHNGNYKAGNRAYKIQQKIMELAKESDDKEKFYFTILDTLDNASGLIACCTHMMKLNVHTDIARKKLEEFQHNEKFHRIFRYHSFHTKNSTGGFLNDKYNL